MCRDTYLYTVINYRVASIHVKNCNGVTYPGRRLFGQLFEVRHVYSECYIPSLVISALPFL